MTKILSVIIPSYNMEDYLQKCLDSLILNDKKQMEMLDVLVINDGSTDATSSIAHRYQARYPGIFRVIDKGNGHYGSCVNRGLSEARGKYVKILDADDWFQSGALGKLLTILSTSDVDMVITNYNIINGLGKIKKKKSFDLPKDKELKIDDFCTSDSFVKFQMHAVTYKRSKLIVNNYIQTEGVAYTDQEWIFMPITYMDTFIYSPITLYQYLIGREGQSMDSKIKVIKTWVSFDLLFKRNAVFHSLEDSEVVSKNKKTYLEKKLKSSVTKLYRNGIIFKMVDGETLRDYDERLKSEDRTLYDYVENVPDKKLFGLRYVYYWRKTGHANFLTSIWGFLLRLL